MRGKIVELGMVWALAASLAVAGPAFGQSRGGAALFATPALADVAEGKTIGFTHEWRTEPPDPAARLDGRLEISVEAGESGGRQAVVALAADGNRRVLPPMPAAAGHPALLLFLESIVANMSSVTGGNPAYIRARLRDAIWLEAEVTPAAVTAEGGEQPAEQLVVRPFNGDPHRETMRGFAELELRFVISDAVPGRIGRLEADTAAHETHPALHERMWWEGLAEGG